MSYDLDLFFEPPVPRSRVLQYFAARKRYTVEENNAVYQNMDTGVYFWMRLQDRRNLLLQKNVASAAFEINYGRPSFFGTEAEIELSDFVATFQARIEDGQMYGMGNGPYSREGFLKGWNFGNVFSTRLALLKSFNLSSMPADQLRAAWEWNYHLAERAWRNPSLVVPTVMFLRIEGRPSTVAVWGDGMPILLPKVDYMLIGRHVGDEKQIGLAPWSAITDVIERAGFDAADDPIKLAYFTTPTPIKDLVANIPAIGVKALERLRVDEILDDELIAAARESIERDKDDPSTMTIQGGA
jgi:hypothetical protein